MDANGKIKWVKSYVFLGKDTIEGEVHRGLIALNNGDLALLGNATTKIDNQFVRLGAMASVDGAGNSNEYYLYSDLAAASLLSSFSLEDGLVLPSKQLAVVGQDAENQEAFIAITNKVVEEGFEYGLQFKNIAAFKEIGIDDVGRLYAIGQEKGNSKRNVLVRFNQTIGHLSVDYAKFINGNTQQVSPHFKVHASSNEMLYTDARKRPSSNDFDIFLGVLDLDFNSVCTDSFIPETISFRKEAIQLESKTNRDTFVSFSEIVESSISYSTEDVACLDPCSMDFSWQQDVCSTVQFSASVFEEYKDFNWNFAGLGSSNEQNPVFSFPEPGIYYVCLTVSFEDGTRCIDCQNITILPDSEPPIINCPNDTTLYAAVNCQALFNPLITIDDCDIDPTLHCQLTGQTIGTDHDTGYNLGITFVNCVATDSNGNSSRCEFVVEVLDSIPPTFVCPRNSYVIVPIGQDSARVNFSPTSPSDCSGIADHSWSHLPNSSYKFGETRVVGTATDIYENTSSCSFLVIVDYSMAFVSSQHFSCREDSTSYDYQIVLKDFAENGQSKDSCTIEVSSRNPEVRTTSSVAWTNDKATITGGITVDQFPYIPPLELTANLTCSFDNKEIRGRLPVSFELCCAAISVRDTSICLAENRITLPLIPNNRFNTDNIEQTTWYVKSNTARNWATWSSGEGLFPLEATTKLGNFQYYAEVLLNNKEQPCRVLGSDTALVNITTPIANARIRGSKEFCYSGSPITPDELYVTNLSKPVPESIQWRDENGDIPGATQINFQPPALSLAANFQGCHKDFRYEVVLRNACGKRSYFAKIRLYNNDAPEGELYANKTFPLCPNEDLVLNYDELCADDPKEWTWYESTDSRNYRPIEGAGESNPTWNTNSLHEDTWFRIIKQNGVCKGDTIDLPVPIKNPLSIRDFSAKYNDPCEPTSVNLSVDIVPTACEYQVAWFYNCDLIHTSVHRSTTAEFTYTGADLSGNYYVNIINLTCPNIVVATSAITLDPPSELHITGPCFRCNKDTITLTSTVLNVSSKGDCMYTWSSSETGNIVDGQGTSSISVNASGLYTLTADCEGCIRVDSFNILQCGNGEEGSKIDSNQEAKIAFDIYPNPASQNLFLEIDPLFEKEMTMKLYTLNRQVILERKLPKGIAAHQVNIEQLPNNFYWIEIQQQDKVVWSEKFIKE